MKKGRIALISLAAALLVSMFVGSGTLRRLDKWMQDLICQHPGVTSKDIIIIGIDEYALGELGPYNTWDRTVMASALEALAADPENKPAVVAIDVLYAGHTSAEADERLAKAADTLGSVVTPVMADFGERITWENGRAVSVDTAAIVNYNQPYEELENVTHQGHINAMSDMDGVMRHALLYIDPEGERVFSMACETARLYLEKNGRELKLPPVDKNGFFYVPFTAKPGGYYDGISIAQLIAGQIPSAYWKDKIVLIGPYAAALQDAYYTTIDRGSQMYGVEFQANEIQSFIEGNFKTEVADFWQWIALFILCVIATGLFLYLRVMPGGILCAGLIVLGIAGAILGYRAGFVIYPLWLPVSLLVLYILALALHYRTASRERQILALEKERLGAELEVATRIQENSLPQEFPPFPDRHEFDIFASMKPAKEVGGDLYDFFLIDDDHLGLVIGDVSGKGVPAALFMMVATYLIHHAATGDLSPARVLQNVNHQLCSRNPEEMFVTVWLGVLEISTGIIKAANAGHEYPALKKTGESFELVKDPHGLVLGGLDGARYKEYELQLTPGSKLFVYTDGLMEARNPENEMFGKERVLDALHSIEEGTIQEILDTVRDRVLEFNGDAPQFDDLTMLGIQYNGNIS